MDPFTQVKAAEDMKFQRQNPSQIGILFFCPYFFLSQFEIKCIKHIWNNYKYINFHLKAEFPGNSLQTFLLAFFSQQTVQVLHREETSQVEVLESIISVLRCRRWLSCIWVEAYLRGCLHEKTRIGASFILGYLFDFVPHLHDGWIILHLVIWRYTSCW